ncbi:EVE domain-containing protein [Dyadobacter psychrotolerans]|uniref:UPF0310 protein E0F88_27660 n=1 Tax=Dyadobacter psychrotolerans TaxID=2541721 RepID=A0A4R5DG21_9BACT|nr:EVE domain-containing protein [Dyadobacter psychrotolerans]TDE10851.1 EVE domain-containing protein [Dyadobacter psychrotolerans]
MTEENRGRKYWVIAASKDHVKNGVAAGITQANHGKAGPLKRMHKNDFVIYYSSKQTLGKTDKCQESTAIGEISDQEIFQVKISENFEPFRRRTNFLQSGDIPVLPLVDQLDFIVNKKSWGYPFRLGFFEINQHDFDLMSSKMLSGKHV